MTTNLMAWTETASVGDRLAHWASMTVEETAPGRYTVTHDDSGAVMWEGEAASTDAAYAAAERADEGSRCGWSDSELGAAKRILRRGGLTLATDDLGLYAAQVQS
jgi:acyl-CoA reductase-like NAD-dependent aldehyde dehydrogenase